MDLLVSKEKFRVEWRVLLLDYDTSPEDVITAFNNDENYFVLKQEYQNKDAIMLKSLIDIGVLKTTEKTTYVSLVDNAFYNIQRIIYDLNAKSIYLDVEQQNY